MVMLLFERVVSLEAQKAYEELRAALLRNRCKIVAEEPLKSVTVEQGSLWGVSPKGAKKKITFRLFPHDSKTRIVSVSSLTSGWVGASIFSYVLGIVLASIFGWIAMDLEASITAQRRSFWGWLAEALGYTGFREALRIANLLKITSIVLFVMVITFIVIGVFIYVKRDSFSEEILRLLP
jgi:hypothetical protein